MELLAPHMKASSFQLPHQFFVLIRCAKKLGELEQFFRMKDRHALAYTPAGGFGVQAI